MKPGLVIYRVTSNQSFVLLLAKETAGQLLAAYFAQNFPRDYHAEEDAEDSREQSDHAVDCREAPGSDDERQAYSCAHQQHSADGSDAEKRELYETETDRRNRRKRRERDYCASGKPVDHAD